MIKTVESRFHGTDTRYADYSENILLNAVSSGRITKDDADLISEFVTEIRATQHISAKRAYKLHYTIICWREFIGPFRTNSIADVYRGIETLHRSIKPSGEPRFKKNTLADYVRFLKRFYLWMQENGYTSIDAKKLQKIRPPGYSSMTKTAEMLPSEEEIRRMIDVCQNSKDRAMICMLYEGGFRIGELGNLRWYQIKFTDWNATVNVDDKTGKPRFVPLIMARPYLAQWRNDYPLELKDDAYVFITRSKEQLQYQGVAKQIKAIALRAGITKKITPHIFRHSRITHLIQQDCGESVIKLMMWGNISTDMFQTYAHLTNADIERVMAEKAGIVTPAKKKAQSLEPKQCQRCYTINGPTHKFCASCGLALTGEAVDTLRVAQSQAELLPEFKALEEELHAKLVALQSRK